MLDVKCREGRARIATWQPKEGPMVRTPNLIVPETTHGAVPAWADVVVTRRPTDRADRIELVSGGTWFHPEAADPDALVVAGPQPAPTGQIQMVHVGDDLSIWHDAGGWAKDPRRAILALIEARTQATPGRLLWAPALGTPADYAVWTYLGVDLFDASPLMLAAVRGTALTPDGPMTADAAAAIHGDGPWDTDKILAFNLEQARHELARIQHAIEAGSLRSLAERRAPNHPSGIELLRRMDREHAYLEAATPADAHYLVPCMTYDSLWSPAVERFRRRMQDTYRPPAGADTLVLLPCSARKPYRLSKSHRYFQRALDDSGARHRCHEVMVTSPLGLVPRDVEEVYPAAHYDVPVTHHWTRDEEEIIRDQLAALLAQGEYRYVIAHVPPSTFSFLRDLLPEGAIHTAGERPAGIEDCLRLRDHLRGLQKSDRVKGSMDAFRARKMADLASLASYQFGPDAAAALVQNGNAHGRTPYVKLDGPEGQRAATNAERGLLALTLPGARIVAGAGTHRVHMGDFQIQKTGSLFAVGVEGADPMIRPGDDVVVVHGDEVRACGIAMMAAEEMVAGRRGVAVKLRHVVKPELEAATAQRQEVAA